ncbi:hypothetical protein [Mycolicibacterium fortuitum]|uniref:hypothetical protein n=1 Tax=Mycolicibacterium fortuitum TaxID=1766 RepID=UPI00260F67EA|nr:hypothetical protein [Mycolicibacterium fortuitum]
MSPQRHRRDGPTDRLLTGAGGELSGNPHEVAATFDCLHQPDLHCCQGCQITIGAFDKYQRRSGET